VFAWLNAVIFSSYRSNSFDRPLAELAEQFDVHPNQITTWKAQLESVAADVFGPGGGGSPLPTVAVKTLHAKIGQLTDFPHRLLLGPGGQDAGGADWPNAVDLAQPIRRPRRVARRKPARRHY
jgi:hypothetical protein